MRTGVANRDAVVLVATIRLHAVDQAQVVVSVQDRS
jgi:hypothetical protein